MAGIPSLPTALPPQFEDALDDFTRTLSPSEKEDFRFTTAADVIDEIGRIQKEQERKRLLRGLRRIEPFVDGLTRYSGVIEQPVSNNAKKLFDTIIAAFARIGHCLLRLETFFSALWSKFDDHFEHLLGNFEKHAALVDAEANTEGLGEAYAFRVTARKEFLEAAKEREKRLFDEAITWLAPLPFEDDLQRCQDILERCQNTGQWLLNDLRFKTWVTETSKPVLWLSGIPGSGP